VAQVRAALRREVAVPLPVREAVAVRGDAARLSAIRAELFPPTQLATANQPTVLVSAPMGAARIAPEDPPRVSSGKWLLLAAAAAALAIAALVVAWQFGGI
jgi:hypothetical protein